MVAALSTGPGVYRFLDAENNVLYVGKAANLRKRAGSYFARPQMEPRLMAMVARVGAIETTLTRTEGEAFLLENELIKSLKPRYNILLKDDKSFPYILLSTRHPFPRLSFHRGARQPGQRYFGPYPSAGAVRETLNVMQRLFRVRQCEDSFFRARSRPCLQYQIGRCTAPCVGLIEAGDYAEDVRLATLFLDGRSASLLDELGQRMEGASAELDFERAAIYRDRIAAVRRVQATQSVSGTAENADVMAAHVGDGLACVHVLFFRNGMSLGGRSFFPRSATDASTGSVLGAFVSQYYAERPAPAEVLLAEAVEDAALIATALSERQSHKVSIRHALRGDRARLVEIATRNAQAAVASERVSRATLDQRWAALQQLLGASAPFARVECFDVSHSHGEATVASCVVFDANGPVRAQYRRYNIREVAAGDDYAAMRQALDRRFRRWQAEGGAKPDLLLIDGGKGQVAQATSVLAELGVIDVRVLGVAKGASRRPGLEKLIDADGKSSTAPADHPGLHLIQQVRDEAHRFAIAGHRGQRDRAREVSRLQEIPGVGARRRQALLKHFGGLAGVVAAAPEDLARVAGIDRALASRIHDALRAS